MTRGFALGLAFVVAGVFSAPNAQAQIFKFKKKDGTVVYTDSLAQLPPNRRAYYNKQLKAREAAEREQRKRLGGEEYERRKKEQELEALKQQQLDSEERARRVAAINLALEELRKRSKARDASRETWQTKAKKARDEVQRLVKEFNELQEKYKNIATKANFALLPGQAEEMQKLREKLPQKEAEVDAAIQYLRLTLPDEARKAGIPPGWIR